MFGSVKTAVGRISALAILGSQYSFWASVPPVRISSPHDLRAGGQRADADPGARQLLGDHAHGGLAHAAAAELFGDGQAEDTQFAQFLHQLQRDQLVLQVPFVGEGGDLLLGEGVELVADHLERLVETGLLQGRATPRLG